MSWRNYPDDFKCITCGGHGEYICECCDNQVECNECDGEGMIGVDLEQLNKDMVEHCKQCKASGCGIAEAIDGDTWVGRKCCKCGFVLRYKDYATEVTR